MQPAVILSSLDQLKIIHGTLHQRPSVWEPKNSMQERAVVGIKPTQQQLILAACALEWTTTRQEEQQSPASVL